MLATSVLRNLKRNEPLLHMTSGCAALMGEWVLAYYTFCSAIVKEIYIA